MGRGVGYVGGLGDGQTVEVGAVEHRGALTVAQHGGDAVAADIGGDLPVRETVQLGVDPGGGLPLRPGELRVPVQVLVEVHLPAQVRGAVGLHGVADDLGRTTGHTHGGHRFLSGWGKGFQLPTVASDRSIGTS